jgi:hypothetical protein
MLLIGVWFQSNAGFSVSIVYLGIDDGVLLYRTQIEHYAGYHIVLKRVVALKVRILDQIAILSTLGCRGYLTDEDMMDYQILFIMLRCIHHPFTGVIIEFGYLVSR